MYRFKNLMVGLTLGPQDNAKIRYAGLVAWLASSERITFSHIISRKHFPGRSSPDVSSTLVEERIRNMEQLVDKYYDGPPGTHVDYEVNKESALVEIDILRSLKRHEIDLIILGTVSSEISGKETIPVKISRKASCSSLYIPGKAEPRTSQPQELNLLVPNDFSENAAEAMTLAIDFAVTHEIPRIYSAHVYDVPLGYYKRGKSYEEFSEIMEANAEKKYEDFIRNLDLKGIYVKPIIMRMGKKPHEEIEKAVAENDIDMIVIGYSGKKAAARVLLDSMTERLIRTVDVPLLAFKKKGKDLSLFDALLRL